MSEGRTRSDVEGDIHSSPSGNRSMAVNWDSPHLTPADLDELHESSSSSWFQYTFYLQNVVQKNRPMLSALSESTVNLVVTAVSPCTREQRTEISS